MKQTAKWLLTSFAVAATILAGLFVWGSVQFGEKTAGLAYLGGRRVFLTPSAIDIGEGPAGDKRKVQLTISNWSASSLTVIGGTSSCACSTIEGLPLVVPAREVRSIEAITKFIGESRAFSYMLTLYVDASGVEPLTATVSGYSLPGPTSAASRPGSSKIMSISHSSSAVR